MRGPAVSLDRSRLSNGSRIHATGSGELARARAEIPTGRRAALPLAEARFPVPRTTSADAVGASASQAARARPLNPLMESAQPEAAGRPPPGGPLCSQPSRRRAVGTARASRATRGGSRAAQPRFAYWRSACAAPGVCGCAR